MDIEAIIPLLYSGLVTFARDTLYLRYINLTGVYKFMLRPTPTPLELNILEQGKHFGKRKGRREGVKGRNLTKRIGGTRIGKCILL